MLDLSRYEGHTPGPWKLGRRGRWRQHIDGNNWYSLAKVVVFMKGPTGPEEMYEGIANARLIADAPALLAEVKALRAFVEAWDAAWGYESGEQYCIGLEDYEAIGKARERIGEIRAALKKALGEQP